MSLRRRAKPRIIAIFCLPFSGRAEKRKSWLVSQPACLAVNYEGTTYGQVESCPDWNIAEKGLLAWRNLKVGIQTRNQKAETRRQRGGEPPASGQLPSRSNCKGPPRATVCSHSPKGHGRRFSIQSRKNVRDARANVCSVMDRETENIATGRGAERGGRRKCLKVNSAHPGESLGFATT
jgi:hypothetical protein